MQILTLPIHEPIAIFAIVILSSLIAPLLSQKFKIPGIIGLILVGVIIGPYGAGLLERDRSIELLGSIGLVYIMFLSGLEVELEQFKRNQKRSLVFGLLTFSIPMGLGFIVARYMIGLNSVASILLASMLSSHTLLTFPTVSQLGLTKRNSVLTTIGGTIITDVLALLVLALFTGKGGGALDYIFWLRLTVVFAFLMVFLWFIVPVLSKHLFQRMSNGSTTEYLFVISILFVSAVISELAGLEGIIGAFFAGLSLSRMVPEKSILMNRIKFIGNSLFIPFFLMSVGMLVNPVLIFSSKSVFLVSVAMVVTVVVAKYLAAFVTSKIFHYGEWDRALIFGLSVNQAAATLAAVLVAYDLKIFDDSIITGTIMMIVVSCFIGAWVTNKGSQQLALEQGALISLADSESPQRIMIPISNPESSQSIVNLSFLIRKRSSDEPIYPINIVNDFEEMEEQIVKAERILAPTIVQAVSAGVPAIPVTRTDTNIATAISRATTELRISELILGWDTSYTLFQNSAIGELNTKIIDKTKQMAMVCRLSSPVNMTKRILLILPPAIERHPGFESVILQMANLSSQVSAKLFVMCVNDTTVTQIEAIKLIKKISVGINIICYSYDWREMLINCNKFAVRNDEDMIVYMTVRKGQVCWQPALDRILKKLSSEFSKCNLLAVYPSQGQMKLRDVGDGDSSLAILKPDSCNFSVKEADLSRASYNSFLKRYAKDVAQKLSDDFIQIAMQEPVELVEQVILLHAHKSEITEPETILLVNKKGFILTSVTSNPVAVFLLLASMDQPSEEHLEKLKSIATIVQKPNFIDNVKNSLSFEDFMQGFSS